MEILDLNILMHMNLWTLDRSVQSDEEMNVFIKTQT